VKLPSATRRNALSYVDLVRAECAEHGVRFVVDGAAAGEHYGYFDNEPRSGVPILYVAANEPHWLVTLAHERGHMRQWIENRFGFRKGTEDADALFAKWLAGHRDAFSPRKLIHIVRAIQRGEHDAERRCLRDVRDWHLARDLGAVAAHANLNVWRYEIARRVGSWPEESDALIAQMPRRLMRASEIAKPPPVVLA